jgi:DNA polymerase (family 10)
MHNYAIADNFSLLSKLIDIHGDDSFKAKSYSSAAYTIEKLEAQLSELEPDKIFAIKGIGQATGKKILEILQSGRLSQLDEYIVKTPTGIFEMLKIKGLGPKKIATIWKELGVESIGELLYACEENRLLLYKGFGAKTQQNIKESIEFYLASQGSYLYSQIEDFAEGFTNKMKEVFAGKRFELTGSFKRQSEVIHKLEWVTDASYKSLEKYFTNLDYEVKTEDEILWARGPENVQLEFIFAAPELIITKSFATNSSDPFFKAWMEKFVWDDAAPFASEEEIFKKYSIPFIPAFYRESEQALAEAAKNTLPKFIQVNDIRGIIHSHSDWSDGSNTIEAMAKGAIKKGLEYLVISDHSQSAYYAKGLYPDRIKAQHELIDELNEKLKPFKIFKSIESDILNDGALDYPDSVLETLDLVITSVHSNFKMIEEKATSRIINAISNPFATILGHMTGRLLLSRNGYPVNHERIIEACVEHKVVIELNSHPRRLDMDWRFIPQALKKGVLISIDPDAHAVDAFDDVKYGVLVAQKAGLTAENNLSSFTLQEFEAFLLQQKNKRR